MESRVSTRGNPAGVRPDMLAQSRVESHSQLVKTAGVKVPMRSGSPPRKDEFSHSWSSRSETQSFTRTTVPP